MPPYDFECHSCGGEHIDIIFSFHEIGTTVVKCPDCGSTAMRQMIERKRTNLNGTQANWDTFYSIHTDSFMDTPGKYKAFVAEKERQGYIVGDSPGSGGRRNDPGQKMGDRIARFGPAAGKEMRLDFQKKNPKGRKKTLTPNQAARNIARRRAKGRGKS